MQRHEASADDSAALISRPTQSPLPNMRRFALGTLAGVAIGLLIALLAARSANYDPTPTLTAKQFEDAYERWNAQPIADYDIVISVSGPQAAVYRASVRSGQAQAAWRNGRPLAQRRTFGTWSVPGMFSTMGRDVAAIEQASAKGAPAPLILRASFHPQHGYPARYRRIDNGSRKGSDAVAVSWDVTEFQIVEPGTPIRDPAQSPDESP